MAKNTHIYKDYVFSTSHKIPKNGVEIYHIDGQKTGFIINRECKKDNALLLRVDDDHKKPTLSKDAFNDILVLVRKYSFEKKKDLIVHEDLVKPYNVQNFVVHEGNIIIPLMGREIEKIYNTNKNTLKIRKPDIEDDKSVSFYTSNSGKTILCDFSKIYIVQEGDLDVDVNSSFHVTVLSETSDFSHISHFRNSDKGSVAFVYNEGDIYKFPKNIDESVKIFLRVDSVCVPEVKRNGRPFESAMSLYPPVEHIKSFFQTHNISNGNLDYHNATETIKYIRKYEHHELLTKDNPALLAFQRIYDMFEAKKNNISQKDILLLDTMKDLKTTLEQKFDNKLEISSDIS